VSATPALQRAARIKMGKTCIIIRNGTLQT
jgi:hypothetical protein